jgi:hypothetical protein
VRRPSFSTVTRLAGNLPSAFFVRAEHRFGA